MKYSISKGLSAPVDDKYCADQQKPPTREPCHGDCMLASWHYTEWSEVRFQIIIIILYSTFLGSVHVKLLFPDQLFLFN